MNPESTLTAPSRYFDRIKAALIRFLLVQKDADGYRTFHGVFLPSFLAIVGVILYLRLGFLVGEMGFFGAASIICLATLITLITAFSISASSTNMKVENGGAYFIISRAFGKVIGSAVGIPLYCAQAIGIAFYTMGLAEAIQYLFPAVDLNLLEFSVLGSLVIISLFSTQMVLRAQFLIFLVVISSLASFYLGSDPSQVPAPDLTQTLPKIGYWAAFALFFPAVTGLEAGISMSGELKNARRSLPLGTITAVLLALCIYLSAAWVLWVRVPQEVLIQDTMIIVALSWSFPLIISGLFGAVLSSALGSLISAPRTLQAIAQDRIVPAFIGKEYGATKEPRIASAITMVIASLCLYLGDLNFIAPILTMFFLITYAMLNLAAGLESLMNNPSWRPTIYIPASISLFGALLCLLAMLLIDASHTLIAALAVLILYTVIQRRKTGELDDIRQGVMLYFIRKMVYRLAGTPFSPRSWRPNVVAFSGSLNPSSALLDLASGITDGKGFLTWAYCYQGDLDLLDGDKMQAMIRESLKAKRVESLIEIIQEQDLINGFKQILDRYGMGPLRPNTVILSCDTKTPTLALVEQIQAAYASRKNLILLRETESCESRPVHHIDIWWDDDERESNDLMILIAHMYGKSHPNRRFQINLNSIVKDEIARKNRLSHFQTLLLKNRLEIRKNVYVCRKEDEGTLIEEFSDENGMVFMPLPSPHEDPKAYRAHLEELFLKSGSDKISCFFLASVNADAIIRSMR